VFSVSQNLASNLPGEVWGVWEEGQGQFIVTLRKKEERMGRMGSRGYQKM